jgi:hypothetical protein
MYDNHSQSMPRPRRREVIPPRSLYAHMLRRGVGPKRYEASGQWRELHNGELYRNTIHMVLLK